jgi:hypothetical protein
VAILTGPLELLVDPTSDLVSLFVLVSSWSPKKFYKRSEYGIYGFLDLLYDLTLLVENDPEFLRNTINQLLLEW